jgi:hypothetical protein
MHEPHPKDNETPDPIPEPERKDPGEPVPIEEPGSQDRPTAERPG